MKKERTPFLIVTGVVHGLMVCGIFILLGYGLIILFDLNALWFMPLLYLAMRLGISAGQFILRVSQFWSPHSEKSRKQRDEEFVMTLSDEVRGYYRYDEGW